MRITLGLTLLLGLLSAVGPISTDIYLPAFSIIDREFGRMGAAQITLASWFVGLSLGQLIQGPLSDRLGRRRPLLYGTLIYSVASIGCALAPGLTSFSAWRLVAALGGSAGMVVPRAFVRDVCSGIAAARQLSRLTLVLGVVPILAPALGGLLLLSLGWRSLFWGAGVYGVACTWLVWRYLPDTLPPERRLRHNPSEMAARFLLILREPLFVSCVLMQGFAFAAMFTYIGGSASVYTSYFHLSPPQYGVVFGISACGYIAVTQMAARLAARFGIGPVVRFACRAMFTCYGVAAVVAFTRIGGLVALAVPICLGQATMGLLSPLCTAGALTRHHAHAGSASALMGTIQFALAAAAGVLIGLINTGTPRPMTMQMVLLVAVVVWLDVKRPPLSLEA